MAYTRVTNTTNGRSAIRYALEDKSHNDEIERSLMTSGNNLDPLFAKIQMEATWESFNKNDGDVVQMYRIIQSFGLDELDPNNQEDIEKANSIGLEFANKMYPDRQSLIVTQADGTGGKLHNHILVNSVSFIDGKSLRGAKTGWSYVADKSDEIIEKHGLTPINRTKVKDKKSIAEIKMSERGKYVWKDDLKARINVSLNDIGTISKDAFIEHLREKHAIDAVYRGKGLSYSFVDADGKKRKSRASRLGENYEAETLKDRFIENKKNHKQNSGEFDLNAELEALSGRRTVDEAVRKSPAVVDFETIRDDLSVSSEEKALIEQKRLDDLEIERMRAEDLEAEKLQAEEDKRRAEKLIKEAVEAERLQKLDEQRRQELIKKRRVSALKDVKFCTRDEVSNEFLDRYYDNKVAVSGKLKKSPFTNKKAPYDVLDIYNMTKKSFIIDDVKVNVVVEKEDDLSF